MEPLNVFAMPGPADWLMWPIVYIPSTNVSAPQLAHDFGLSECLATRPESQQQLESAPIKRRIRLKNAKLPRREQPVVKSQWRVQNRSLPKPLNEIAHFVRTSTWDKAPLENDVEFKSLLEQTSKQQWEPDSTHASDSEPDSQSCPSEHQDMRDLENAEEDWDAIIGWVHENLPPLQYAADPSDVEARFHGVWGPAFIEKDSLVWNEGEAVKIDIVSETQFSMTYYCDQQYTSKVFSAELHNDGKLHWSDGDVWSRETAQGTCDSAVPRVLPPWLRKYSRRSRRDEPPQMEPRVRCPDVSEMQDTSVQLCKRANGDMHTSSSPPNPAPITSDTSAPKVLPPWLQKKTRKCRTDEPMTSSQMEPRVGFIHGTDAKESSKQRADSELHGSGSYPCVVSVAASDDIPVGLARTRQDTQSTDRNRNCSKADSQTHECIISSSCVLPTCSSVHIAETAPTCQETILSGPHKGIVKWFRGSYGWVDCAEVKAKYSDCDIFLHMNDCDFKPRQGDAVDFFVAPGDMGNPKAVRVTQAKAVQMAKEKAVEMTNGRDYFAARDAKLAMQRRK
jgi:cold shock CspA family protein